MSHTLPICLSWHAPGRAERKKDGEGLICWVLRAQGESLGFTDREIFCGLFSSSSCHCLFNSESTFLLSFHQGRRYSRSCVLRLLGYCKCTAQTRVSYPAQSCTLEHWGNELSVKYVFTIFSSGERITRYFLMHYLKFRVILAGWLHRVFQGPVWEHIYSGDSMFWTWDWRPGAALQGLVAYQFTSWCSKSRFSQKVQTWSWWLWLMFMKWPSDP